MGSVHRNRLKALSDVHPYDCPKCAASREVCERLCIPYYAATKCTYRTPPLDVVWAARAAKQKRRDENMQQQLAAKKWRPWK